MRTYQPIWEQLKTDKNNTVRVAAPRALHRRIKKAVTKEKDNDVFFKILLQEQYQKAILDTRSEANILIFKLRIKDSLRYLSAKDLFPFALNLKP